MGKQVVRTMASVIGGAIVLVSMSACSEGSASATTAACAVVTPAADSINSAAHSALQAIADDPEKAAQGLASATESVKNVQDKLPTNLRNNVQDVVAVLEDLTELSQSAAQNAELSPEQVAQWSTKIDEATAAMVDFCS